MVLMLSESDVERLLDMGSAIAVVEEALKQQAEGRATNRPRQRVALPTGQLNFMAAGVPESRALGLKAYTAFPSGYRFYCMLFDSETGELLALIQADRLGQVRTGAASAVATRHLAREDATALGIYGTGWQAESQLEAIHAVRSLEKVVVYSRQEGPRTGFAEKMGRRLGLRVVPADNPEEPAAQSIVVTATSSREPVLRGEWLQPGAHINAAGSNFLSKTEIDSESIRRASFVCIDARSEINLEAGDLLRALETGVILPEAIYELGQVIAGQVVGRTSPDDITLFESQGLALKDMAVARLVYDRAQEEGLGQKISF